MPPPCAGKSRAAASVRSSPSHRPREALRGSEKLGSLTGLARRLLRQSGLHLQSKSKCDFRDSTWAQRISRLGRQGPELEGSSAALNPVPSHACFLFFGRPAKRAKARSQLTGLRRPRTSAGQARRDQRLSLLKETYIRIGHCSEVAVSWCSSGSSTEKKNEQSVHGDRNHRQNW